MPIEESIYLPAWMLILGRRAVYPGLPRVSKSVALRSSPRCMNCWAFNPEQFILMVTLRTTVSGRHFFLTWHCARDELRDVCSGTSIFRKNTLQLRRCVFLDKQYNFHFSAITIAMAFVPILAASSFSASHAGHCIFG